MSESTIHQGEFQRICLDGKGMSGKGVRYRILAPAEVDQIERVAAMSTNKETTKVEFEQNVIREAMYCMIAFVTTGPVPKIVVDVKDEKGVTAKKSMPDWAKAAWQEVTAQELTNYWGKHFNTKETQVLKRLYLREHLVSEEEVDAVLEGKACEVVD